MKHICCVHGEQEFVEFPVGNYKITGCSLCFVKQERLMPASDTKTEKLIKNVRLFANDGRLGRELDIYRNWPQDLRDAFWDMCNACDELMEELEERKP